MIKEVMAQCNVEYLKKLFDIYNQVNDEHGVLKVGGRIIQKLLDTNSREFLIKIFDKFYEIVNKEREIFRSITELQMANSGDTRKQKYSKEYKEYLVGNLSGMIKKIVKNIKKTLNIPNLSVEYFLIYRKTMKYSFS